MAVLTRLRRLLVPSAPTTSVEIAADRVTGLTIGRGSGRAVLGVETEGLPDGALLPTANAANMADRTAVIEALGRVLKRLPGTPNRVALVIPDSAAKVSLMAFEQIPARAADLDQLVRWQARKTAPFRIEDAQVSYSSGLQIKGGGRELVVSLMRRDIVEEYEAVCADAGAHAGVVDLASFSLVNAVLAGGAVDDADVDWLLVHVAHGYCTVAIVRNGHLILFRNRPAEGDGNLADLVHQTTMHYEDRLEGGGFARVFLAASAANTVAADAAILRSSLETRVGTAVEAIGLRVERADGEGTDAVLPDLLAAPLGLLLRERLTTETGRSL
jgi:type IV pilus assembly protein PilM